VLRYRRKGGRTMRARFVSHSIITAAIVALCVGCISVSPLTPPQAASPQTAPRPVEAPAATAQAPAPTPAPVISAPSSGEAPTDESIGDEIRRRLNADPTTAVGIVAEVQDRKVVLRGTAPTMAVAARAETAARGVLGVESVVNEIIVNNPNPIR